MLVEQKYPSGRVVRNEIDVNGDLAKVESKKNVGDFYRPYASNFVYNAAGAVTSMRLGNGKFENTQFNSRLQPTQIGLGSSATNQNLLKLNYDYGTTNNNGNVLSQQITVNRNNQSPLIFNQTYVYDSLNRLKSAEEKTGAVTNWKQVYTFDRYGNRNFDEANTTTLPKNCGTSPNFTVCPADVPIVNPSVNAANNRLNGYTFDASGNTITDAEGRTFTYDAENKQVEVENSLSQTVGQYIFDGDGKRIKKIVPSTGEITIFVYDGGARLIGEYSTIVLPAQDAKVQYLTNDHLGSPRINTDGTEQVVSRTDYLPYGEEIVGLGGRSTNDKYYVAQDIRNGFTGYLNDDETGLDFAQARMFASQSGRFTTVDPLTSSGVLANPQSFNRYSYTLNSPLTFTDPLGLISSNPWDDREEIKSPWQNKKDPFQCRCMSADPSTHIDKNGKVITVFDDNDNGVYQHGDNADGKTPTEAQIKKRHAKKGTSAGGTKIGDTQYWDEFVSPDTGKILTDHIILVGTDMTSHIEAINKQATKEMNLYQMAQSSRNGGSLDIKAVWGNYGILLNGLYVTTRSAGNYLAGLNGATGTLAGRQIDWETFQKMAGAVQVFRQQGKPLNGATLGDIYLRGTAYGPAPTYGELEYQRRMSIEGFMRGRNR